MPDAVLALPTIVHLMVVDLTVVDTPKLRKNNKKVQDIEGELPGLLASAEHPKSANAIWKPAGLRFDLDRTRTVQYKPQDIGLTLQELEDEGLEIQGECNPDSQHDQRVFRTIQEKFGTAGFRGLQVFVWAKIDAGGGCAMSHPAGIVGAVWLEAHSLADPTGFRLMAHEIGHFLTLRHVEPAPGPKRLMTKNFLGTHLTADELAQAKAQALAVMSP
jgi:hypothetical protein